MNKLILIGATVLFGVACSKSEPTVLPDKPALPADKSTSRVVVMELGKPV